MPMSFTHLSNVVRGKDFVNKSDEKTWDSIHRESPPKTCKSLSLRIPMSFTHLSDVARGKAFVNKLARLSHDLIYKILISPPSCSSCG
jgi:hypothetical protein